MKPTFSGKYTNYINTITDDEPIKYELTILEEIKYFMLTILVYFIVIAIGLIIATPILLIITIGIIPYIIYQRYEARKAMKNDIDDEYINEEDIPESEETEC